MRTTLADSARENAQLAAGLVKARGERESAEKGLRTRIGDLEELLHHSNIKLKGTNADGVQNATIRNLQQELSSARAQMERWRVEAVQVLFDRMIL